MRYRAAAAALSCAVMFAGCSERVSSSEEMTTETSAAADTTASESVNISGSSQPNGDKQFYTRVSNGSIDIFERGGSGVPVQVIEGDFREYNSAWFENFDFDGFEDMGVTTGSGCLYYRYDSDTGVFSGWQTLSDVGEEFHISELYENCLAAVEFDHYGSCNVYYKWENGSILPFSKRSFIRLSCDDVIEFFNMGSDGQWVKVTRNTGSDGSYHLEEFPPYFRINEDSIDVMVGEDVVQTIEGYRLPELADSLQSRSEGIPVFAENLISEADLDNDGYFDAYIIKDYDNGYIGDYYRYDPEKRQYVPWDELDHLGGAMLYLDLDEKGVLHKYDLPLSDNTYKWSGGRLKLVSRDVYEYDGKGGSTVYRYEYDDEGRETFIGTEDSARQVEQVDERS